MGALIEIILPVFLVLGFGYGAVRVGWFSNSDVDALMRFIQRFAVPCLLFLAISRIDLKQDFDLRLLASFYTGAASSFALGLLGGRYLFHRPWEDSVAIGFTCLFSNSVLLGLPIAERAFGSAALSPMFTIIAVHSPFCYLLGISAMEIVRNRSGSYWAAIPSILKAMFSNSLILGIAAGFAVNLGGIPLPASLGAATELMARAALPAAIFGLGGVLTRYRPDGDLRIVLYVISLSLLVHPAIAYGMVTLFGLGQDSLRAAVITASMAPGVNTYIFANLYGKARRIAATSLLLGTAASAVSIWVWLQILG
ncbi:MAG: AEC family transporter [Mangrovicoccus sp.]|nr:AEC family transporter [Mangrovicoccus sp.]